MFKVQLFQITTLTFILSNKFPKMYFIHFFRIICTLRFHEIFSVKYEVLLKSVSTELSSHLSAAIIWIWHLNPDPKHRYSFIAPLEYIS